MKMDRTYNDRSAYYYDRYSTQSRRRTANINNSTSNKDQEDVQIKNTNADNKKNDNYLDSSYISNVSVQKSDVAPLTAAESKDNTSGSFNPFSALEKLISISTDRKKHEEE